MIRTTRAFVSGRDEKNYKLRLLILLLIAVGFSFALIVYDNPVSPDSPSYGPVVSRRINALIAMFIAATCQSLATLTFQSLTTNKVITPSLLGFESLYSAIQTTTIYLFGATSLINFSGLSAFLIQMIIMVGFSLLLYGTLLRGKNSSIDTVLLIGVVIGQGLKSLSSFMRRLLSPSEFDILQARLFASVNHADQSYYPLAIPLLALALLALYINKDKLNVLSLGKDVSINLGLNHNSELIKSLLIVSILMSISTSLVGPMTFFGFLSATLAYQLCPSYDHKYLFLMVTTIGFLILAGAYFIMNHVFYAQGVVTILIELVGGLVFLSVILKRRDL